MSTTPYLRWLIRITASTDDWPYPMHPLMLYAANGQWYVRTVSRTVNWQPSYWSRLLPALAMYTTSSYADAEDWALIT